MRKRYTVTQKAQIVLEVLKEEQTVSQIASPRSVHPTQLRKWKAQVLEGLPNLFNDEKKATRDLKATLERELYLKHGPVCVLTERSTLIWARQKPPQRHSRAAH